MAKMTVAPPRTMSPPSRIVWSAELHLLDADRGHAAVGVARIDDGVGECHEFAPLFLGVGDLLNARRYLRLRAAVDDHRPLGAQAAGGAHGIHGRVAAPDHGDAPLLGGRRIELRELVGLHQIVPGQVFV